MTCLTFVGPRSSREWAPRATDRATEKTRFSGQQAEIYRAAARRLVRGARCGTALLHSVGQTRSECPTSNASIAAIAYVESISQVRDLRDTSLESYKTERAHDSLGRVPPLDVSAEGVFAGQFNKRLLTGRGSFTRALESADIKRFRQRGKRPTQKLVADCDLELDIRSTASEKGRHAARTALRRD